MTGAVKDRTDGLGLGLLYFNFPNWGDDMNKNMQIIDSSFSVFGIAISGAWENSTAYTVGMLVVDTDENAIYRCLVSHTSAATPTTFTQDRVAHPSYWGAYSSAIRYRGDWTTATQYYANETFTHDDAWFIVIASHISGDFEDDHDDDFFSMFFDPSGADSSAAASAAAALVSENNAETAETNAEAAQAAAEVAAANSIGWAGASEGYMDGAEIAQAAAAASASAAGTSATNAANSATAASGSATTASNAQIAASASAASASANASLLGSCQLSGQIEMPQAAEEYIIVLRARQAGAISRTTTICTAGTCTATWKVNTTAIGGSAHAVSTTEQSITRSTAFNAGDDIKIAISGVTGVFQLSWSMEFSESV